MFFPDETGVSRHCGGSGLRNTLGHRAPLPDPGHAGVGSFKSQAPARFVPPASTFIGQTMTLAHTSFTILGAGLLGRLLAVTLARQGHAVSLYDKGGPLGEHSAARVAGGMLAPLAESAVAEPRRRSPCLVPAESGWTTTASGTDHLRPSGRQRRRGVWARPGGSEPGSTLPKAEALVRRPVGTGHRAPTPGSRSRGPGWPTTPVR